ncbi:hypothetical protein HHI36_010094 [Cryptolaemus montrouzieri]|uniref:E3 ubiquitin-protein ligase n=1 Tax=Cryptolaemus montrouzieri TaxID=559131 RepID=A0ABD2MHQ4_9CUCU
MEEEADIDMSSSIEEGIKISKKWKEKFEKGELKSADFEEHWKIWVPKIYTPGLDEDCLNWNFDEQLANNILYYPLMHFICDGDPESVLAELCQEDKPNSVCTRVFKMGEPTYSCRECGMDNTCVLCVDCFRKSEHRNHKYKMGTSLGGGCCDCGDVEAWKRDPYCEIHMAGIDCAKQGGISTAFEERARIAFEAVLWYAFLLLTSEQISDIRFCFSSEKRFNIDMYCTILYNDEVHTFEQVISTLSRVLKCNQRNAIAFVTNIDREGRAVVKCSDFQHCNELRTEIEKYTSRHGNKPLKVIVSHAHIIAHQLFSLRLLAWLQGFLGNGEGFRRIFAEVALKPQGSELCIIKGVLLRDSSLWKSARAHWHRLFISGMLPEYENKKALAKIFTKNYGHVMKDFIRDDHDHSYSIASLSVQLFPTPTIAHHLIAHDDIFFLLLNTFISECVPKCNKAGKLEFERNPPTSVAFKRAQHMLYDLRYLLSSVPPSWTDELRRSFLHGLNCLYNLLTMMQGMDATTRQIGQHMEYEPEWESAFNLHIKLSYCISLALKWCGTDRVVLIKAYRAILKCLVENPCFDPSEPCEVRELADHSTACLHYDVSTKPVSIHLPLTRFLVGLHLHLEKFNLGFDSLEFQGINKPTPVEIIEPVLRTQVLVAQVHAGMWRRNGYGLLNQLFFYQNVRFRTEMYDRDVTALQIGASLIESNEFLIHCLNKYNLINWASNDFEISSLKSPEEESMRQTINLVEEFLQLLIVIIGERHMAGLSQVSPDERIRKEIIQHLCIKRLLHSELTKNIPDEITEDAALDDIINELAEFKRGPQGTAKGVYKLKNEYYDQYNVFYYHYSKEELSKSEENQRKRRAGAGKLECCPPPQLPKLHDPFAMIVNLLQCDVMLHIMQTVLSRCLNLRARSFSELQLHKVLHLIGYALQEEQTNYYAFFKFVENSNKFKILNLLEELLTCPRVDAHKDLLKWTINEFKKVANELDAKTLLSKDVSEEVAKVEKERRATLAAERRAKIMAHMAAMQKNFIKENALLYEETSSETTLANKSSYYGSAMDITEPTEQQVALGNNQSARTGSEKSYTCILCQKEEIVRPNGPVMVLAAFVQESTVLSQNKCSEDKEKPVHDPLYLHANLGPAPHTNTCGHAMHGKCWEQYYDHVIGREHRRPYRLRHPASFDVDKQEYLCPLCECLSNTALPIVPSLSILQPETIRSNISFGNYVNSLKTVLSRKTLHCHGNFVCDETNCKNDHCVVCYKASDTSALNENCEAQWMCKPYKVFYSFNLEEARSALGDNYESFSSLLPSKETELDINLLSMVNSFVQVPYSRGLHVYPDSLSKKLEVDGRINPMAWKSLAYTIHSIEMLLRDCNKPLLGQLSSRQRDGIECFVKLAAVLGCCPTSTVNKCHALALLEILIDQNGASILQWDSFGFLVALTFSLPSLSIMNASTPSDVLHVAIPTGGTLESHTLKLIFAAHIVRILILLDPQDQELKDSMETDAGEDSTIVSLLKLMNRQNLNAHSVWNHVKKTIIPFLRCCVLFYHYLTEVPAPSTLLEIGGDTFSNLCSYLNLPENLKEIFVPEVMDVVERWCKHEEVTSFLTSASIRVVQEPLKVNHLIDLPSDYSELMNTVSSFTCPKSDHEDARNPTMCLVCGDILCSQSYCCQTDLNKILVGACNYHAHTCGADFGIFLRVRDCEILLLASPHRGCFMSAPYLDDYGETDQGLKRGNPLRLCPERYRKLQLLWSSHGILEEIARTLESSTHVAATQWHHL